MIKVTIKEVEKVLEMKKVYEYIMVVVDYEKEEKYSNLVEEVNMILKELNNDFSPKDIKQLISIIDEDSEEYFIYDKDEIIETMFPGITKSNRTIQSAYNWIKSTQKIEWLVNNVFCDKKYYDTISNMNNNFIVSTKQL